jgi:hypothetical protein
MGRGAAVRIFHTLHRLGVAEAMVGDDDADWLERLADDIAPESERPAWFEHLPEDIRKAAEAAEAAAAQVAEKDATEVAEEIKTTRRDANAPVKGVSAPPSTTLTDGVYDEIRRLRSKVAEN